MFQLDANSVETVQATSDQPATRVLLEPRDFPPSAQELEAHAQMLAKLKKPVWEEAQ